MTIFDFIGRWKVAPAMGRAAKHAEGSPVKRVPRVQNLDLVDRRFVSFTTGDIPVGLRSTASIGGTRAIRSGRSAPDKRRSCTFCEPAAGIRDSIAAWRFLAKICRTKLMRYAQR
jgi:hypothetical protein